MWPRDESRAWIGLWGLFLCFGLIGCASVGTAPKPAWAQRRDPWIEADRLCAVGIARASENRSLYLRRRNAIGVAQDKLLSIAQDVGIPAAGSRIRVSTTWKAPYSGDFYVLCGLDAAEFIVAIRNRLNQEQQPLQPPPMRPEPQAVGFRWTASVRNKVWALVIGVSEYENDTVPDLPLGGSDAESFRTWLTSSTGLDLQREHVRTLTDAEATYTNIRTALRDLARRGIVSDDLLLVYFSGHGAPEVASDGSCLDAKYLLPYEADPSNLYGTAIPMDALGKLLDDTGARTQVVFLDACYAGAVGQPIMARTAVKDLSIRPKSLAEISGAHAKTHCLILTAVTGNQVAVQPKELGQSLFTHYLLNSLDQGRITPDWFLDLKNEVRRAARKYDAVQDPEWIGPAEVDITLRGE